MILGHESSIPLAWPYLALTVHRRSPNPSDPSAARRCVHGLRALQSDTMGGPSERTPQRKSAAASAEFERDVTGLRGDRPKWSTGVSPPLSSYDNFMRELRSLEAAVRHPSIASEREGRISSVNESYNFETASHSKNDRYKYLADDFDSRGHVAGVSTADSLSSIRGQWWSSRVDRVGVEAHEASPTPRDSGNDHGPEGVGRDSGVIAVESTEDTDHGERRSSMTFSRHCRTKSAHH